MNLLRPAWLEINLDNLRFNIENIRSIIDKKAQIIAVVKNNAYGFGTIQIVNELKKNDIECFAVAITMEGLEIRRNFKDVKILVLGATPQNLIEVSIENDIMMTIFNLEDAIHVNEIAKSLNKIVKIHIAIDTGMNRIGFLLKNAFKNIKKINSLSNVQIEGIFTHFASADDNEEYTKLQFNRFKELIEKIESDNIKIPIKHVNNSMGIINYQEYSLDAVRPGILMYGSSENKKSKYKNFNLKYIAELKTQISNLKEVESNEGISYGLTYITKNKSKIATIPIGYGDGILRQLSNKISVLVNGKRCKQVGRICMDQMMIDVTDVDCKTGDEVVIMGKQNNEEISIFEISRLAEEIDTSFSGHFSNRLPRIYFKNNEIIEIDNGLI